MHEHVNFIANVKDKKHGAFVIVSIRRHAELFQDGERPQHLAIVRTKESDELLYVPCSGTKDKDLAKALRDHVPALLKADLHAVRSENVLLLLFYYVFCFLFIHQKCKRHKQTHK